MITHLKKNCSSTIIVISHDIDEITRFATRLIVFNEGRVAFDMPMNELFKHQQELVEMGLDIPLAVKIANDLKAKGVAIQDGVVTVEDLIKEIVRLYNAKHNTKLNLKDINKSGFNFSFRSDEVFE